MMYRITYRLFGGSAEYVKFCFNMEDVKKWTEEHGARCKILKIEEYEPKKVSE